METDPGDIVGDALSTVFRKGLFFSESIRNGLRTTQLQRAKDFANALDVSPVTSKFSDLRSASFGSMAQYNVSAEARGTHLNVTTPFILPTRENCSLSPATRRRESTAAFYNEKESVVFQVKFRQGMLIQEFGHINPALYQEMDSDDNMTFPEGHLGRLWFQLAYDSATEKLICTLVKAKNLPCRPDKSPCDPFVRVCLLPDERRTLQTKVRRKSCDPRFDEAFVFPVSAKSINERVLRFSVLEVDKRKKHNLIGHACHSLADFNVINETQPILWKDLQKDGNELQCTPARGELLISLCYNSDMQRLTVNIVEGKHLHAKEKANETVYVKVSLMHQSRLLKCRKTQPAVSRPNMDGKISFNESFHFKLASKVCEAVSLVITAEVRNKAKKEKTILGRVMLGGLMFARGKELEHWQECMQLDKEHVQEWHTLSQL